MHREEQEDLKLIWYKEVEHLYKDTSTATEYMRYNQGFQRWFDKRHGKAKILQAHVRDYVKEFLDQGKSTQVLISALKFRFNECEKRNFSFKGLNKSSEHSKAHKILA